MQEGLIPLGAMIEGGQRHSIHLDVDAAGAVLERDSMLGSNHAAR